MHLSGFGAPLWIKAGQKSEVLKQVALTKKGNGTYDEAWLQNLLFRHPEALPVAEIDASFSPLIPLCMEMGTPSGPIDTVYVTPTGRLALLEAKLWRNPEARRKVVGQILDYAKELPNWDYSRLESAVRLARKNEASTKGEDFPGIFEYLAKKNPGLEQHKFHDAVTKSLAKGDFLLLVAGDGIREGLGAIAQYLDKNGSLHFTFGLIECAIYEAPDGGHYVHPRVLAQTTKIPRTVFVSGNNRITESESEEKEAAATAISPELEANRTQYKKFWNEFLKMVRVEASQFVAKPAASTNQYFWMPQGSDGWISAYLAQSKGLVGVYLRFNRGEKTNRIYEALGKNRDEIDKELGVAVDWRSKDGQNGVSIVKEFPGELLTDSRVAVQKWLADHTERFISVFRPRIDQILREQG